MDPESERIIKTYFGEPGLLPLPDPRTFDIDTIPTRLWQDVESRILDYQKKTVIPGIYKRLFDLAVSSRLINAETLYLMFVNPSLFEKCETPANSEFFIGSLMMTFNDPSFNSFAARQLRNKPDMLYFSRAYETKEYDSRALNFVKNFLVVVETHPVLFTDLFEWMTALLTSFLESKKFDNRAEKEVKRQYYS